MTAPKNPLQLARSPLTGRVYAFRQAHRVSASTVRAGDKEDVTEQVAAVIDGLPDLAQEHRDAVVEALGLVRKQP